MEKTIQNQISRMQNFFYCVQQNEEVRSLNCFINFLMIKDYNEFEKQKKGLPIPKCISEIYHLNGKANVSVKPERIIISENIIHFMKCSQALYDELIKLNEKINNSINELTTSFEREIEIYENFNSLCSSIKVMFILW